MRCDKKPAVTEAGQHGCISIAWALHETSFNLELSRSAQLNRFDRVIGLELWTTHEFAEALLPRLSRTR
jgi:hypothetical protein